MTEEYSDLRGSVAETDRHGLIIEGVDPTTIAPSRKRSRLSFYKETGAGLADWLKILLLLGALTGLGYLISLHRQELAQGTTKRWHHGRIVERIDVMGKQGPWVVLADDSLGQNVPLLVTETQYVNLEEGDSIRVRVRDKDVEPFQRYHAHD